METICIQADTDVIESLTRLAKQRTTTLEAIAEEALVQYLQSQSCPSDTYSFIGVGHSGKGNISTRVEEILKKSGNRREGRSPDE